MTARTLSSEWIHLGLGATAEPQPPFSGMEWFGAYMARHAADGAEARLVSQSTFTEDWDVWEMHPEGAEVVICIEGEMELVQEHLDGTSQKITLTKGQFAINPPGTWHTANIAGTATGIFITAGKDTQHQPR